MRALSAGRPQSGLRIIPGVNEANVLAELRKAEAESDVVLIDLPGGSSTLSLKALQRSNYVIIPCQASLPDVRDAIKTIGQIDDAQDLARAPIERSIIWTRILPGFESRVSRHVRESVEGKGVPIFAAGLMERAAFREFHVTGKTPRQVDPTGAAAANIAKITEELLSKVQKLAEAAA